MMCLNALLQGYKNDYNVNQIGERSEITQCGFRLPYVFWRIFWALYHFVWIIITGVYSWQWAGPEPEEQVKWFIYLTDWCYFMLTISTLIDAIVVIYVNIKQPEIVQGLYMYMFTCNRCCFDFTTGESTRMTWYLKTDWVLLNVANCSAVSVALLYWGLVHNSAEPMTAVNIETHALNAVYVILNLCVVRLPVRFYHLFHSVIYGAVYIVFSGIYYGAGGTNENGNPYIYSVIDWRKPGTAVLYSIVVVFIALPVVHMFLYCVYLLRILIHRKCCQQFTSSKSDDINLGYHMEGSGKYTINSNQASHGEL
ncbi:hypothetical protein KUTeg_020952 [Tegillarca granosa]|uniref:Protein rolling stone n=1 Tax=Tegillarca granosa TaxID=220873 RepID=A0ABQ9EEV4_TEGGR|nr:hypothetical protein KUTeg_020952 [Tegillarca granosa]